MRNIADLIKKAHELKEKGFTTGLIADELNISRETALWLVTHETEEEEKLPKDIYIDWSVAGSCSTRLRHISLALTDLIRETLKENGLEDPDVVVGIATSGIPIATVIAEEMNASLAIVRPKKHLWEPDVDIKKTGYLLSNFAKVKGKKVVIVDDIATTGTTIQDTIDLLKVAGAKPLATVILIDKKGIDKVDGIPVKSLIRVGIVGELGK
jgi:orotate phosphoribosyltransferase